MLPRKEFFVVPERELKRYHVFKIDRDRGRIRQCLNFSNYAYKQDATNQANYLNNNPQETT